MIDTVTFGQTIKEYREYAGISCTQLADMVGVTPRYIYQIEAGKRMPKMEVAIKLMSALSVDIKKLYDIVGTSVKV